MTQPHHWTPAGTTLPQWVAGVYEAAPDVVRGHLLEQLLRPLGALSLVAVADGVFAKIRFRSGWQTLHVHLEDLKGVSASQVMALVDHAQQVSAEAVDGLAQMMVASPGLPGATAAAAVLGAMLLQRARAADGSSAAPRPEGVNEGPAQAL